jgi:uncharacterized membrane protein
MQAIAPRSSYQNVHPMERLASVVGGGILAVSGMRKGLPGLLRLFAGAAMVERGLTGRCHVYRVFGVRTAPSDATIPYELGIRARAAVTVNEPRHKMFHFWRQSENLPTFMRHLLSVEQREGGRSHWVAEGPLNHKVEWEAEIINEIPEELIAWKSLPGSDVDSAGSVRFKDAPGGRGTEVHVELQYNPPAGLVGAYTARLFGREPEQEIEADLGRLKQYFESGEVATTKGQPRGSAKSRRTGREESKSLLDEVLP